MKPTFKEFQKMMDALPEDARKKLFAAVAEENARNQKLVTEKLPALYAAAGYPITDLKGQCDHGDTAVAYWHDGVQYAMDSHGKEDIAHGVNHLKLIIERHHSVVKQIYLYCVALGVGDIWALTGGGCQLQVFFGNSTGYLAILYLDMDNSPMGKSYSGSSEEDEDADEDDGWTLQVNWVKNDPLFANLKIKGVNVRTSREVYGDDND